MTLRGVLIGCGYIAQDQLAAWRQVAGADIVAVCDLDPGKAQSRADAFGIPGVYTDYRRMLDDVRPDFVDIATQPASHPELVRAGAQRGLHVLCQKPMAASLPEAQAMTAVCQQAGVTLMVNENCRHQAWFRQARELISSGALGDVHGARFESRWRATLPQPDFEGQDFFRHMPRLIVYELGVHFLDTARYLFGEAHAIYASLRRVSPHIAGEDSALVAAEFGGLTCVLDLNWFSWPPPGPPPIGWGTLTLEGTLAVLRLRTDGQLLLDRGGSRQAWHYPADTVFRAFVAAQQHFVDCLQSGTQPETSGADSLRTMQLVFGAYQSAAEGRVVQLADSFPA